MRMARLLLSIAALLAGLSDAAFGQTSTEVAPGGKLRVGMIAITVLGGVAEPVARFVGQKLGAAVEPVMYPNPEAYRKRDFLRTVTPALLTDGLRIEGGI
jgi:hypothetical protein